jgi:hypothetical protein
MCPLSDDAAVIEFALKMIHGDIGNQQQKLSAKLLCLAKIDTY